MPGSALSGGRATRLSLNDLEETEPYVPANKEIGKYRQILLLITKKSIEINLFQKTLDLQAFSSLKRFPFVFIIEI